mmetsp:Transcript_49092/g.111349  ORF Transcript_49092/g.111349 Transcript_49092/m.111349 type:complete len:86 (-) Transcript_49092:103-360(-)
MNPPSLFERLPFIRPRIYRACQMSLESKVGFSASRAAWRAAGLGGPGIPIAIQDARRAHRPPPSESFFIWKYLLTIDFIATWHLV